MISLRLHFDEEFFEEMDEDGELHFVVYFLSAPLCCFVSSKRIFTLNDILKLENQLEVGWLFDFICDLVVDLKGDLELTR